MLRTPPHVVLHCKFAVMPASQQCKRTCAGIHVNICDRQLTEQEALATPSGPHHEIPINLGGCRQEDHTENTHNEAFFACRHVLWLMVDVVVVAPKRHSPCAVDKRAI